MTQKQISYYKRAAGIHGRSFCFSLPKKVASESHLLGEAVEYATHDRAIPDPGSYQDPGPPSGERKRSAVRARAFTASVSRSRGGAFVTSDWSSSCAAFATCSTARLKAGSLALEGLVKPLSFRTN